MSIIYIA